MAFSAGLLPGIAEEGERIDLREQLILKLEPGFKSYGCVK
jgi:hypothetical protein